MSVPRYLMDEKGFYLNPECPDLGLLFSSPAGKLTIEDIKSVRIPVDVFSGGKRIEPSGSIPSEILQTTKIL